MYYIEHISEINIKINTLKCLPSQHHACFFPYHGKRLVNSILGCAIWKEGNLHWIKLLMFYFSFYLISTCPPTSSSKNNSTNANITDYSRSINFILPQKEVIIEAYSHICSTVN